MVVVFSMVFCGRLVLCGCGGILLLVLMLDGGGCFDCSMVCLRGLMWWGFGVVCWLRVVLILGGYCFTGCMGVFD